jgi:hypothetical protein
MVEQGYTFVINSRDKISGDNNNATFNINFNILPREYKYYQVSFSMITDSAFYVDTYDTTGNVDITYAPQTAFVACSLLSPLSRQTDGSPSDVLGIIVRNQSQSTSNVGANSIRYFVAQETTNVPITVLRPQQDNMTITIVTGSIGKFLVSTNLDGSSLQSDMSNYVLILKFTPIKEFHTEK